MSDIINFANASQTIDFINEANALSQASGWDVAQMANYYNPIVAANGMRLVGFEGQAGANAVTQFSAANAPEAYASYVESGGLTASSSAAVTNSSVGAGTVALAQTGAGAGVVGVATGSAGLLAAGCAPLFGVALGAGLYEAAPDFWTDVSQALVPWAWDLADELCFPVVYDENGNTYISQDAIGALYDVFTSEGLIGGEITVPNDNIFGIPSFKFTRISAVANIASYSVGTANNPNIGTLLFNIDALGFNCGAYRNNSYNVVMASNNPNVNFHGSTKNQYTYDGRTVYYTDASPSNASVIPPVYNNINVRRYNQYAWLMVYGGYAPSSDIEQVTEWQGDPYPSNPNTIDVLTGFDENDNPIYKTYQQVALPIGDPLVTNDPLIQPDPYYNPQPEVDPQTGAKIYPAIDPYVNPVVDPSQYPDTEEIPLPSEEERTAPLPSIEEVPETAPVPDPATDPSTETTSPPENSPEPTEPISSGTSPSPLLPLVPLVPTSGTASLFHVYNPTVAQVDAFGSWLWQSFLGVLFDDISRLFNNPMDAVIGLQEFYGTPNISGSGTIRCGYLDSEVPSAIVGSRYSSIDCGSIVIPEYYGNYLDYAPYTQTLIYLPFIGIMSLNADDIIGNAVNVVYHLDSWTGSCIAIVTVARSGYSSVVYQFEGNCSVEIPLTGGQQSALKGALIGGISGAVMGGIPGAVVGAVAGGLSTKNDVQHSGSFSASHGAMGAKIPFIIVRRPVQKRVWNYSESYGYPAHKMVYVGNCRGYLRVREVRVLSTTATNEEKQLIVNALKAGVYVKN